MNIFEIAEKFHLSVTKVKRMEKAGVLIATGPDGHPMAPAMRLNLSNKQPLSVDQLCVLIQHPGVIAELRGRQSDARDQIAALGDYAADKPAAQLVTDFVDAGTGDAKAIARMIDWLKQILPDRGAVNHQWVAVRAVQHITNHLARQDLIYRFSMALKNCRKHPDFQDWYHVETIAWQKRTIYFRPDRQKILDKYDL